MGGGGAGPGDQDQPRHGEQRGDQPPQHRGLRRLTQPGNTISLLVIKLHDKNSDDIQDDYNCAESHDGAGTESDAGNGWVGDHMP